MIRYKIIIIIFLSFIFDNFALADLGNKKTTKFEWGAGFLNIYGNKIVLHHYTKLFMRTLLGISIFIGCLFFTITILGYFFWYQPRFASSKTSFKVNKDIIVGRGYSSFKKVKSRAFGLKKYCNQKIILQLILRV